MNISARFALVLAVAISFCGTPSRAAGFPPKTHDEFVQAGNEAFANRQLNEAMRDFNEALKIAPSSALARLMRGTVLLEGGDDAKAIVDFTAAILLAPSEYLAFQRRAVANENMGHAAEAASDKQLAAARQAALGTPTTALKWQDRGIYLETRSEFAAAIAAYDAALQAAPDFKRGFDTKSIYERRADLLANTGAPAKAITDYAQALLLDPKSLDLVLKRARAKSSLNVSGNNSVSPLEDFTTIIDRAAELGPNPGWLGEAYVGRASLLADRKEFPAAFKDLDAALALAPKNLQALALRALINRRQGKNEESLVDLNAFVSLSTTSVGVYVQRALIYGERGDYAKSLADYDRAVALAPKQARVRSDRGAMYFAKGDMDQALLDFSAAILLEPTLTSAWNNRGATYARQGQWNSAISDYTKAIELDPARRSTYLNRAIAYRKIETPDLATADEAKAKEVETQ